MIIGIVCFIIFLFTVYQLSKDDFLFIRKGVNVENVFNVIFLGLPIVLFTARLFYVLFNPRWNYLNPLIFFVVPYFPGLSLVGGILGAWIFVSLYTKNKKIPSARLLDMLSLSFLLTICFGILIGAAEIIFKNRVLGVEEIGRGILVGMLYIVFLLQFIKGSWIEGSMSYLIVVTLCFFELLQQGTFALLHQAFSFPALIANSVMVLLFLILFVKKQRIFSKLLGK